MEQITKPLVTKIFEHLDVNQSELIDMLSSINGDFFFQHFPAGVTDADIRFDQHKDFGVITLMSPTDSGMEIRYQDQWHAVNAKENYLIVNMANALEKMTDERCHAVENRVRAPSTEDVAMILYVNPDRSKPIKNHVDGSIVSPLGEAFIAEQINQLYAD